MPNISSANSSYIQSQQILRQILPQNASNATINNVPTLKAQQKAVNPPAVKQVDTSSRASKRTLILSTILAFGGVFALIKAGRTPAVVDNSKFSEQLSQLTQDVAENKKILSTIQDGIKNISANQEKADKAASTLVTQLKDTLSILTDIVDNINNTQRATVKNLQIVSKTSKSLSATANKMAQNAANNQDLSKALETLQKSIENIPKNSSNADLTAVLAKVQELVGQLEENNKNVPKFDMKTEQLKSMVQTLALASQRLEKAEQNVASANAIAKGTSATQAKALETLDKLSTKIDGLATPASSTAPIVAQASAQEVVQNVAEIEPKNVIKKLNDIIFNSGKAFNKADNSAFSGTIKDVTPSGSPFEMLYDKGILQQAKHGGKTKIYTTNPSKIDGIVTKRVTTSYDDRPDIKTIFKMTLSADKKDRANYTTGKFVLDDTNNLYREIRRFIKTGNKATIYEATDGVYENFGKKNPNAQQIIQYNTYALSEDLFKAEDSQAIQGGILTWPRIDRLTAKTSTISLNGEAVEPQTKEVVSIYKKNKGNRVNVGFKEMD